MDFIISREALLKPLNLVAGVVERRQTLPILSNVLLCVEGNRLSLTGTDLEVELIGRVTLESSGAAGSITLPARKLVDICKSLPDGSDLHFSLSEQKMQVRSGSSRFTLSTLPAVDFPSVEDGPESFSFSVSPVELKRAIEDTAFAMAQQDVRYYLNGMLWEVFDGGMRVVATDGHRLALSDLYSEAVKVDQTQQMILPRKGVLELARLLVSGEDTSVEVVFGSNHVQVKTESFVFTSKLIDGKFPDYKRVLPKGGDKIVISDRDGLKQAFNRAAILSNEKYRGVRMLLSSGVLQVTANNPEQEEAEDQLVVEYDGDELEIGFNVTYLLDVLGVISGKSVKLTLLDANSSALVQDASRDAALYVVMPMRL